METTSLTGHIIPLYSETHDDESRSVQALFDGGGYLIVGERTEGDLSLSTFGARTHYHQIVVAPESLCSLARACCAAEAQSWEEIVQGLQHLFETTGFFLSELMDRLDAASVPYGYLPNAGTAVVSYRPAFREDGSSY